MRRRGLIRVTFRIALMVVVAGAASAIPTIDYGTSADYGASALGNPVTQRVWSRSHSAWAKAFSNCRTTKVSVHDSFTVN